ncbi:MAG TPA: hypothetical protein PK788_12350, partial [Gemmatimonadaceae bacterium]|nr:hypothetical protein [Gemmatimonadaceae bacterium]
WSAASARRASVPAAAPPRSRDSATTQSYRSELAHFLAVLRGETSYDAHKDQVRVYKLLDVIYKAADEAKEIRL